MAHRAHRAGARRGAPVRCAAGADRGNLTSARRRLDSPRDNQQRAIRDARGARGPAGRAARFGALREHPRRPHPVRKSAAWWDLAQDERRQILEERSRHVSLGLRYLPAIARRLYHSRDMGEPFDFLTWFEYAKDDAKRFEELVAELRRSPEWEFVEREVDVRLAR